jgi:hypothetical protein
LISPPDALRALKPGLPVFATSLLSDLPEAVVSAPAAGILATRKGVGGFPVPLYLKPPHITKPAA